MAMERPYPASLSVDYPDRDLDRLTTLLRNFTVIPITIVLELWLLAIPHYVVLFFLGLAAFVVVVIAWFAILFTGRYPRTLFDFVVGVLRWGVRVEAYALILATDRYPPFSLRA